MTRSLSHTQAPAPQSLSEDSSRNSWPINKQTTQSRGRVKTKAFTGTWDMGACCRATLARRGVGGCGALPGEVWHLTVQESSPARDSEHAAACGTWGRGTMRPICRRCIDATRHCATVSLGKTGPGGVLPTRSGLWFFALDAASDTFFSLSCQCYLKCTATHHPLRTEVETSPGSRFCLGRLWGLNLLRRQEPPFYSRGLASSSLERSG